MDTKLPMEEKKRVISIVEVQLIIIGGSQVNMTGSTIIECRSGIKSGCWLSKN